jgi:peroxiredoxin
MSSSGTPEAPAPPGGARSWAVQLLATALAVSLGANVWLMRRVNDLAETTVPTPLQAGAGVPAFSATELGQGRTDTVRYDGVDRPTVLYVFSPSCVWCERNLPNVKALVQQRGKAYRFVGLSLSAEGLAEHARAQGLPFPIYSNLSAETIRQYGLGVTPQTIVVSPEGRVLQTWRGAYGGPTLKAVERYFEATLPGLEAPTGS